VTTFIRFKKFFHMRKVCFRFPCVVRRHIAFPFDKVLIPVSSFSVADDCFYLVFFLSINKIRRRFNEVSSVCFIFLVRSKEVRMEHRVKFPLVRQFQSIGKG
jgi:hypothetical protein